MRFDARAMDASGDGKIRRMGTGHDSTLFPSKELVREVAHRFDRMSGRGR